MILNRLSWNVTQIRDSTFLTKVLQESMTLECQGWSQWWWWGWLWAMMLWWHGQAIGHDYHWRKAPLLLLFQFFQAKMWSLSRPMTKPLVIVGKGVYDEVFDAAKLSFNLPAHWVWRGHEWRWDLCNLDPCCYKCPLSLSVCQCHQPEESQKANFAAEHWSVQI